ncbi:hypothetical protein CgunFtcFv8_010705 [Champsocephalus gunnari]|uniref:Uncharacterized protein n=1 Tax=Champsocephalus gunnari TaxID=52237 RepID=A0AAN8DZK7_CHAGU|nr:hypothetical protein CgunFtcFv8_010705 [Champsocephalus gunnari]
MQQWIPQILKLTAGVMKRSMITGLIPSKIKIQRLREGMHKPLSPSVGLLQTEREKNVARRVQHPEKRPNQCQPP